MQEISVVIFCRNNQARSIVIGALLRKFFHDKKIITSGIDAKGGTPIPEFTVKLCESWSLGEFDRTSSSLEYIYNLNKNVHMLAADDSIRDYLKAFIADFEFRSLSEFCDSKDLIPIDPIKLDFEEFCMEIAKALILSLRWANEIFNLQQPNISSILFRDEDHLISKTGALALEQQTGSLLVYTDFANPSVQLWEKLGFQVIEFNPRQVQSLDIASTVAGARSKAVLISRFEIDFPERIYLSTEWRNFLIRLSKVKQVNLVSTLYLGGRKSHIGILGLSHSLRTRVLS